MASTSRNYFNRYRYNPSLKEFLVKKYREELSTLSLGSVGDVKLPDAPLSEVYSKPYVREGTVKELYMYRSRDKIPVKTKEERSQAVHSYREIFNRNKHEHCLGVLLIGEPGTGKTTFCHHFLSLWCDPIPSHDNSNFIKEFDYIFFVRCRDAAASDRLIDMILKQNFKDLDRAYYQSEVESVLQSEKNNNLIIIDGVDEWAGSPDHKTILWYPTGFPSANDLHYCTYLATTRPWRLEVNGSSVGDTFQGFELAGFDKNGLKEYVRNVAEYLDAEDEDEVCIDFLKDAEDSNLDQMLWNPFEVKCMLSKWIIKGFDKSLCNNYVAVLENNIQISEEETTPGETATRLSITYEDYKPAAMLKAWETSTAELPSFLSKQPFCQKYRHILKKLLKFSFEKIFDDDEENAMVISRKDLDDDFPVEEVDFLLRSGVLTQAKYRTKSILRFVSLAYVCPNMHQFVAAAHMSGTDFDTCLDKFLVRCKKAEDILHFRVFIISLCGMNPEKGKQLCKCIAELPAFAETISQYRQSECDFMKYNDGVSTVVRLQEMLLSCFFEVKYQSSKTDKVPSCTVQSFQQLLPDTRHTQAFVIQDIFIDEKISSEHMEVILSVAQSAAHQIQSLVVKGKIGTPAEILKTLKHMNQLKRLHVSITVDNMAKELETICKAIYKHPSLKYFGLHVASDGQHAVTGSLFQKLLSALNSMSSLTGLHMQRLSITKDGSNPIIEFPEQLSTVTLDRVTFSSEMLVKFHQHLPNLQLFDVDLPQPYILPLNLKHLALRKMTMTHQGLQELCSLLHVQTALNTLTLEGLYCSSCTDNCHYHLNLSNCHILKELRLSYLYAVNVRLNPKELETVHIGCMYTSGATASVISPLRQARKLNRLTVGDPFNRTLPLSDLLELQNSLESLTHLETLEIRNVDFGAKFTLPAEVNSLKMLKLVRVQMISDGWREFVSSVMRPGTELQVILARVNMTEKCFSEVMRSACFNVTWSQVRRDSTVELQFHNTSPESDDSDSD